MVSPESKLMGAICHGSIFFGLPILVPLIVYLLKKDDDFVNHHARESLTMHIIAMLLCMAVGVLSLVLIGILLIIPLAISGLVYAIFAIVAIIKCLSGEYYYYPITSKYANTWFNG
ncbi:Chloroplast import component protein (Tic20) [Sporotomaculum syntrophicum]|uniref:Chloroplast import component protein (Tic20) n=1 Tax=Sporotomaculum syntrophicum TaxID=182264 RepID=A0A9D2WQM6_9FIRM|nr:DUF4870 domain-containing protein [Sporotomaculum syntrophicum]KAF1085579.1 Chloroplast import component protein (Tic20) [Sporotomaculum syntrophicum]